VSDPILSLEEVAAMTPWSKSTLYREAPKADSPFWKRAGRWVCNESDLNEWVRSGSKPRREHRSESPMPRPRRASRSSVLATVHELRRSA
jgi:predicted DNA-binding transcriptional regulator AlpA